MPSSHYSGGNALGTIDTKEGSLSSLRLNTFPLYETINRWRWTGAHEFAHNLGLLDLYPYDPTAHQPPPAPGGDRRVFTRFGLMSMWAHFHTEQQDPRLAFKWSFPDGSTSTGYDYNLDAEEMLAWSRWQLGWLDATQIHCMTETENTITLRPVADPGDGIAMVAIPLSDTELVVMESRRKIGYDAGEFQRWPSHLPRPCGGRSARLHRQRQDRNRPTPIKSGGRPRHRSSC